MENDTSVIEMLNETSVKLEQIKELNKEIHSALDVIEKRRNKQHETDDSSKEAAGCDQELKCPETEETIADASTLSEKCTDDAHAQENNEQTEITYEDEMQKATKIKSILKTPETGLKHSYGFKERLNLNFNHVVYGSKLKRKNVEMNQDNRLCQEFGLEPNIGNIYESRRPPSPDGQLVSVPTQGATSRNGQNKQVSINAPDNTVAKIPRSNGKQAASGKRSTGSHSKQASRPLGETVESKVKMKKQQNREQKQLQKRSDVPARVSTEKSESSMVQQAEKQHMSLVEEALQNRGDQLQIPLPREVWINTMLNLVKLDEEQKQGLRTYFEAFIDVFFGKGSIVNVGEFINITKEKFVAKISELHSADEDASVEEKQYVAEQLANTFFDENGKFDLLKCAQGAQMMNLGLTAAIGQSSHTEESSEESDIEVDPAKPIIPHSPAALMGATHTNEDDENDSEVERIDVDPDVWVQYANEEVKKGKVAQDVRESGMDTIICLDLSYSMRGYAWQQATTFIKKFMEGIQNTTLMDASYEHIALVTYGAETRVQQHLTCDYLEIIRKLDRLKPSGPSPMYAGLQMVHAAIIGAGNIFKCNGYKMYPRVFLITDGKFTPAGMISGPDRCPPELVHQEQFPILRVVKEIHDKYHVTIYPVPVGEFDTTVLESILHISKGKIISPEDWRMQSRAFKNYLAAAKACGGPFFKLLAPGLKRMMLDAVNASQEDRIQMEEFLNTHSLEDDDNDSDYEADNFPPLGSRVRSYKPGSTITAHSKQALGTVTKHFSDGCIGITWDAPNADGQVREKRLYVGVEESVTVVDEPRVLHDQMIAEGCRVKRGKDWSYPDQDGGAGNLGNVYCVKQNGIVSVRWDIGTKNTYKFGAEGKFDLEIVGQTKEIMKKPVHADKATKEAEELTEEMKVQIMNEKNRSIYDIGSSEAIEGAPSLLHDNSAKESSKNKKNASQTVHQDKSKIGENAGPRHVEEIVSRITENISSSIVAHVDKHTSDGTSVDTGAKPKTSMARPLEEPSEAAENKANWKWLDGDNWQPYPPDINEKIEYGYKRNPRGTTVIRLNDIMYRVVFTRMEKINVETKEKYTVARYT